MGTTAEKRLRREPASMGRPISAGRREPAELQGEELLDRQLDMEERGVGPFLYGVVQAEAFQGGQKLRQMAGREAGPDAMPSALLERVSSVPGDEQPRRPGTRPKGDGLPRPG